MAIGPAVAGSASAAPPVTSTLQAPMGGDPSASGDMTALIQQLRQVGQLLDQIAQENPDIAQMIQPIKGQLKQVIVQKAQTAPQQTPSAMALPMGGA